MLQTEFVPGPEIAKPAPTPYAQALKDVATSGANLLHNELALMRAEFKASVDRVREHTVEVVVFGGICVLSIFPFMVFFIMGLRRLAGIPIWLSALIVGIVFAAVGGIFALRAYRKIKNEDVQFVQTKSSLERTTQTMQVQVEKLKHAIKGERYGSAHSS